eukprot:3560555-Heterocapsa_arctica.AAC.1
MQRGAIQAHLQILEERAGKPNQTRRRYDFAHGTKRQQTGPGGGTGSRTASLENVVAAPSTGSPRSGDRGVPTSTGAHAAYRNQAGPGSGKSSAKPRRGRGGSWAINEDPEDGT